MTIAEQVVTVPMRRGRISGLVKEIQEALRRDGADLATDGVFGPKTEQAVRAFQGRHGLVPTGIVDVATAAALDKPGAVPRTPIPSVIQTAPWLATMRAITGTKEIPGPQDNPLILHWRDVIAEKFPEYEDYEYTHDSIPWCGLTAAYCLAANGIKPPNGFLWVDSWNHSPLMTHLAKPIIGCFLTFTRHGGGHIAIMEADNGSTFTIRGGNQSDMVNVVRKSKSQFTAALWPIGRTVSPPVELMANTNAPAAGKET